MAKQTELVYTEKEQAAITALKEATEPMSLKDLGVASGTMVSIMRKAAKFPEADGVINVVSTEVTDVCPTCGAKHTYKKFSIAD